MKLFSWYNPESGHAKHIIVSLFILTIGAPLLFEIFGFNKWTSVFIALAVDIALGTGREIFQAMIKNSKEYGPYGWQMYFNWGDMKANATGWVIGFIIVAGLL